MKIIKKKFNIILSVIFILFAQNVYAVESKDPIKLTLHDWTGQLITTNIMAEVLKEAGYNIELVPATTASTVLPSKSTAATRLPISLASRDRKSVV